MIQNDETPTDQECNLIDVNGDSEPEYGVMAVDVVQINNVELLKTAGGQPRSLSIQLRSGNSFFYSTVDTGSPVSFLNKKTADILMKRIPNIKFKDIARHPLDVIYVDYNKKPIKLFGSLEIPIASKGWKIDKACFLVSENRTRNLLGLNLHEKLGIETVQRRPAEVSYAEEDEELDPTSKFWRNHFVNRYPNVFSRLGRSKNHKVFTNFKDPLVPRQVKGRKVPIHLQDRVTAEIKKLIKDKHIEKLEKCTTDHFIAPIVLTAKKDGSIKLALNAKPMNAQIWQNKYQMPNMHELIDSAAQIITKDTPGEVWFTSLDLKYAFSQLPLSELTSSHCNFSILCGEATGTYRFKTGFYGLTDMPTEFQKAMDCTLQGLEGVICYLDDILVVTKGRVEDHNVLVERVMSRLDEEGWALKLSKCEFSLNKLVWLGYEIDENGYAPKFSKIEAIKSLLPPKTLKQLRSFMGTLNHLQRFIPDLHKYTVAFRASLKAENKKSFLWGEEQTIAFQKILNLIANIPNLFHYDASKASRLKCDASHSGLGACLEQEVEPNVWAPIAFASRFLNSAEIKYSTNELELLAIVWSCEHFRTYLLGTRFVILTDHKAIISALNETYGKKSYQSRLSRWADRLIPFDYHIEHIPGSSLGIVDYLSRYPTFEAPLPSSHDELFVIKSIQAFHNALNSISTRSKPQIVPVGHISQYNEFRPIRSLGEIGGNISYLLTHTTDQSTFDSSDQSYCFKQFSSSPHEGVTNCTQSVNQSQKDMQINHRYFSPLEGVSSCSQSTSQSYSRMQKREHLTSPREVDVSCSGTLDQSQHSMQMRYAKPKVLAQTHCPRPYNLEISYDMDTSNNLSQNTTLNSTLNNSTNTVDFVNTTVEQTNLLNFVENFSTSSPNFRTSSQIRPKMSTIRPLDRPSRIDQIRSRNIARLRHSRERFVVTRGQTTQKALTQFLDKCRRQRLTRRARRGNVLRMGINAINNHKPLVTQDKKKVVGLPGLFDVDLLGELTGEDPFLGPMRTAIINKDVQSFNKLGTYMAQFWTKAAVVNNCVLIDNKLAIPEQLRSAILTRLHRSHPGQAAMMDASEYIWWPFLNRQIVNVCEKCPECTLFGKNIKTSATYNSAKPLPTLSAPNQELQLDFAGPLVDDKKGKIYILVAIDRFSKFPSVMLTKSTSAKKIVKFLRSYIRNHGIPESIRTDHGSGFHSDVVKEFCKMRGIKHILTAVGDHRSCGLVERSIQTIKRKLGTENLDPNFTNLKSTLQQIIDDIRKTKHSTLKVSPFELHFGRKPNTEFSLARDNVVHSPTSAQGLERNLLTPEQRSSQDYSRDRAKVVPRGSSHSPEIPLKFKPLFGVGERIADSQPYKALENLAKAANTWKQWKRNVPPQQGQNLLRELAARNSDLANSLKTGITKGTLRFYDNARDTSAPALSHSQRLNVSSSSRPKRLSKTRKLEKLVLQDPLRVKIFRKVLDRNSGKPLFKLAKIKITRVTDHTYITDKGKVYRKNHISLRHNFNLPKISATPGTVGERLQRRIAPRPQSQPATTSATRQSIEPSKGKVID